MRYYDRDKLVQKSVRLAPASATMAPGGPPAPGPGYGGASAATPGTGVGPRESPFGPAPAPRESPLRLGPTTGGGGRLLNRIDQMADNLAPRISTVYNPEAMVELQRSVAQLTAEVKNLSDRLKALEARQGGSPPAPGPGLGNP